MFRNTLYVVFLVPLLSVFASAQGTIDEYGNYHPTEDAIAKNKRIGELLQYPTVISLRLLSQKRDGLKEEPSTTPSPYSAGQRIHFELFLTQNTSEDIVVPTSAWPYREYRPELIRDGDVVPYTEGAKAEVEKSEKEAPSGLMGITTLIPGREILWSYVRLEDWYESPLKLGHYQLIVRKRFARHGEWTESNPVTFDVINRESSDRQSPSEEPHLKLILSDEREAYQIGDNVGLKVTIENQSDFRASINIMDTYYQYHPKLLRNGRVVDIHSSSTEMSSRGTPYNTW